MIYLLLGGIAAGVLAAVFFKIADDSCNDFAPALTGLLLTFVATGALVCSAFAGYGLYAAKYKVNIINREYGTEYTREEIFYASDVIDTIRELDRKRVEINGDLFKKE